MTPRSSFWHISLSLSLLSLFSFTYFCSSPFSFSSLFFCPAVFHSILNLFIPHHHTSLLIFIQLIHHFTSLFNLFLSLVSSYHFPRSSLQLRSLNSSLLSHFFRHSSLSHLLFPSHSFPPTFVNTASPANTCSFVPPRCANQQTNQPTYPPSLLPCISPSRFALPSTISPSLSSDQGNLQYL